MSGPRPSARELRAMKRDLRRQLKAQREAARAALAEKRASLPGKKKKDNRRRNALLLLLLLLLLLVMIPDCNCAHSPGVIGPPIPPAGPAEEEAEGKWVEPPGRIGRRDRPEYDVAPARQLPWLEAFRMQVAARSPRMAECFVGTDRPGAIRWTTSVVASSGQVSAHELEPMLQGAGISQRQGECLIEALSEPAYQLPGADPERSVPDRVSLVIEF